MKSLNTSNIYDFAQETFKKHNLGSWVFSLDSAKRRAGCCKHAIKMITLSFDFVRLNSDKEIIDVLLHEIAHALVGPGHGHDETWKQMCVKVGAKPERCYDSKVVAMPKGSLVAECGGCQKTFSRHRQVHRGTWRYCLKCGPEKGRLSFRSTEKQSA